MTCHQTLTVNHVQADQSGEFDPYFGTDMKDTRPAPVLETKIKKNEDIMERLRRLEMNNN